ncbi:hypothetical protein ACEQPO_18955 [Bacillus sp. SL00103]
MKKWMKMSGSTLCSGVHGDDCKYYCRIVIKNYWGEIPQIFGYQFKQVLSGSNGTRIYDWLLIVVKRSDFTGGAKKEILSRFKRSKDQSYVTHRIVGVKRKGSK